MSEVNIYSVSLAKVQLNTDENGETNAVAYSMYDELPFDCYGLYGKDEAGCSYHLADFKAYKDARSTLGWCISEINANGGVGHSVPYERLLLIANH